MKKLTLILTFLLLWTVVCGPWTAYAAIPHLISYQGRLANTNGDAVPNSTYSVTFRIYTSEAGGADIWNETDSVTTREGIFEVLLGGRTALDLPFDTQYYLGIQVGSDPEMTPRQKLASVGYAYMAEKAEQADNATSATEATNADTVDGIHASTTPEANKIVPLDANAQLPTAVIPDGSITQAKLEGYAPGECLLIAADAEVGVGSSYTKKKEIKIVRNGTIRFKWRAWANYSHIYTRVYRNGVPGGNEHHLAGGNQSTVNYSEDISGWSAGDIAQLYARGTGVQNHASHFRLYIDKYIEEIILLD